MENETEEQVTQNEPVVTPEENDNVEISKAELEELRKKAEVSEQNYARLKKAEEKLKETPLPTEKPGLDLGTVTTFVRATRDLTDAELQELAGEAENLKVDVTTYLTSKAGKAHLSEFRRTNKSTEATPSPSSKIKTFNGKPVSDILKDPEATASEKQAAFEARMKA